MHPGNVISTPFLLKHSHVEMKNVGALDPKKVNPVCLLAIELLVAATQSSLRQVCSCTAVTAGMIKIQTALKAVSQRLLELTG